MVQHCWPRTDLAVFVSVLGVPVQIETNADMVVDVVRTAYGPAPREVPTGGVRTRISVVLDPHMPPQSVAGARPRLFGRDRLLLHAEGAVAYADAARAEAVAFVSESSVASPSFAHTVLDPLTLFLVAEFDRQPVHAAGIAHGGAALLLAGASGVGKSSLAYAAMRDGLQVLADDAVYVQRAPRLQLWAATRTVYLSVSADVHFPELAGLERVARPNGRAKIAVSIPAMSRISAPWTGAVGLCMLSRGGEKPGLRRMEVEDAVALMRLGLEPGFDRFADSSDQCVRSIASAGAWQLTVSGGPQELVRYLRRALKTLGNAEEST